MIRLKNVNPPNRIQQILFRIYKKVYRKLFGVQIGTVLRGYPEHIHIGENVRIANNVTVVSRNHDKKNPEYAMKYKDVIIEDNCWIGANAVVLPDVHLGENTVVGAGSIVTNSFPEGHCILVGNPAKKVKEIG